MAELTTGANTSFSALSPTYSLGLSKWTSMLIRESESAVYKSGSWTIEFSGTGFEYSSTGGLIGGTISGIGITNPGGYGETDILSIQGFEIPVEDYLAAGTDTISLVSKMLVNDDTIVTSALADDVRAGDGDDTVSAGSGADTVSGGAGSDLIFGNKDNDKLVGGTGFDTIYGGQGNDTISGDADDDVLFGQMANDIVNGGAGDDWIHGGQGNDNIAGNAGNDSLYGGLGDDTLAGGTGNDMFVFARDHGSDVITDFKAGEDILVFEVGVNPMLKATQDSDGNAVLVNGKGTVTLMGIKLNSVNDSYFMTD